MLEKELIGEQLSKGSTASATDSVGFDDLSKGDSEGSPNLGKFKNVDELIKAYNNLQSEFTKKCQTLNELLKQKENTDNVHDDVTPVYEKEDWQERVDNFLQHYPQAKEFSKEIADVISSDKGLMNAQNSLEMAFCKVMENENTRLKNLLSNKEYLVKNIDDESRELILKDYLSQVNNNSPALITSRGGNNIIASYKKPLSVNEAGELVKKLFK